MPDARRQDRDEDEEDRRVSPARASRPRVDEDEYRQPRPSRRRDEDEEDRRPTRRRSRDDEEDDRPSRRERPRSNLPLILGIGAGCLVLVVCVVGLVSLGFRSRGTTPVIVQNGPPGGPQQAGNNDPIPPADGPLGLPATAARGREDAVWVDGTQAEPPVPLGKDRPNLVLDAGGHTSAVRRCLFSPDGRHVVTASQDKTIRVWDTASGESLRTFRLAIGPADDGAITAAALSPDGSRLAVSANSVGANSPILVHLIDLAQGKVERVFEGHLGSVVGLDFSRDGRQLATASVDRSTRIFDVASGRMTRHLFGHADRLTGVKFAPDGSRVVSISADNTGRVYSLGDGKFLHALKGHTEGHIRGVDWSRDGKTVATAGDDGFVRLWGLDGKQVKALNTSQGDRLIVRLSSVSFNPDGSEVLYGGVTDIGKVGMIDVQSGKTRLRFDRHDNTVLDATLSADGALAVSTGGNDHDIFVWKPADGSVLQHLKGVGRSVWGIGWSLDGKHVGIGHSNRGLLHAKPLERAIRVADFEPGPLPPGRFIRSVIAAEGYQIEQADFFAIRVKANGKEVGSLRSPHKGERIFSMTLIPGNRAVIGGGSSLFMVDLRSGKLLRHFSGHAGTVLSLAPSPDGKYFVSGSTDQTVCFWSPEQPQPLLSLFVADRDWIASTPEGYYSCSAYGERLMGWQVNQGAKQLSVFHPAARFRRSLYHPDVLREVLPAGGLLAALDRLGKPKPGDADGVTAMLPPEVRVTSPAPAGVRQAKGDFTVEAEALSLGGHAVASMRLLVNGRPYDGEGGMRAVPTPKPGKVRASWKLDLPPGRYAVSVLAESAVSKGVSEPVVLENTSVDDTPPTLYILAVGVSEYEGEMKLNYAATDARAIVAAFEKNNGGAFREVKAKLITDRQATGKGIVEGLRWLSSSVTARDVAVVFFSGHGTRDPRGNFHFVPVDFDPRAPARTCIPGEGLKRVLGNLPGRVIAMFDACHSGAAAEKRAEAGRADDLARDLVTEDYGIVCMCSSLGEEYSMESSEIRAGFFTLALAEGLSGRADVNRDRTVHLHELAAYATLRVRQMTNGKQNPVTGGPPTFRSFPVARGR